jgi:hypothetical protein
MASSNFLGNKTKDQIIALLGRMGAVKKKALLKTLPAKIEFVARNSKPTRTVAPHTKENV